MTSKQAYMQSASTGRWPNAEKHKSLIGEFLFIESDSTLYRSGDNDINDDIGTCSTISPGIILGHDGGYTLVLTTGGALGYVIEYKIHRSLPELIEWERSQA